MSKKKLPLSLLMIRGAVGKSFVIKHYKFGTFMTKYPDMTRITPSKKQRICRNLFKEAVVWAKTVIADTAKKKEWQKRLKRTKKVYHAAIKEFMMREKKKLVNAEQIQFPQQEQYVQKIKASMIPVVNKRVTEINALQTVITTASIEQRIKFFEAG